MLDIDCASIVGRGVGIGTLLLVLGIDDTTDLTAGREEDYSVPETLQRKYDGGKDVEDEGWISWVAETVIPLCQLSFSK